MKIAEIAVGLVLLIKVLLIKKKSCNFVIYSSQHEEIIVPHEFIFCIYPVFPLSDIIKKMLKSRREGSSFGTLCTFNSGYLGVVLMKSSVGI